MAKAQLTKAQLQQIHDEILGRVAAAVREFGQGWSSRSLIQEYMDAGLGRSTAFRWVQEARDLADVVNPKRGGSRKLAGPTPAAVADIPAPAPDLPPLKSLRADNLVPVLGLLQQTIEQMQQLVRHARDKEGNVRNARLLMDATERLRRVCETAAKLNDSFAATRAMEAFHALLLEEIGREAPAVQQRILSRLQASCEGAVIDG